MTAKSYTATAIALHWSMALLILAALPLGLYMVDLPLSPTKLKLYSYHKWAGITVLALFFLRLGWRVTHPAPPAPGLPPWQARAAHATHQVLYLLMLLVPLSGWLMSSAKGFQTVWLGVLPLPDLVAKDETLAVTLELSHRLLAYGMGLGVLLHIAAALKHQWLDRDGLLGRMLPWGRNA